MNIFSFKSWVEDTQDFILSEAAVDFSHLPLDNINLVSIPINGHFDSEDFSEESFDENDARQTCEEDIDHGNYDLDDYSDEPIYDEIEEDDDFDTINPSAWKDENPEPEIADFNSKEEYDAAHEAWIEEYDGIESDYNLAVQNWERENERRKSLAQESIMIAMEEDIDSCVEEARKAHKEEQEEARQAHEEAQEQARQAHEKAESNYQTRFRVNSKNFKVELDNMAIDYHGKTAEGIFKISFAGPSGYATTNRSSPGEAKLIYDHLLASIVKMTHEEEYQDRIVNGFMFDLGETKMGLVYHAFYERYLKPLGFIKTGIEFDGDDTVFMRREYVKELMSRSTGPQKEEMLKSIKNTHKVAKEFLRRQRERKGLRREKIMKLNNLYGKIVFIRPFYRSPALPAYIVSRPNDETYVRGLYFYNGRINNYNVELDDLEPNYTNPQMVRELLEALKKEMETDTQFNFNQFNTPEFRRLYNQYFPNAWKAIKPTGPSNLLSPVSPLNKSSLKQIPSPHEVF